MSVRQPKMPAAKGTNPGRSERTVPSLRCCKAAHETRNLTPISVTKPEKSPKQASRRQLLRAHPSFLAVQLERLGSQYLPVGAGSGEMEGQQPCSGHGSVAVYMKKQKFKHWGTQNVFLTSKYCLLRDLSG